MGVNAGLRTDKTSSVATHKLGDRYTDPFGRTFIYCKAGSTALVRGKLTVAPDVVGNHTNMSFAVAPAIGDKKVQVTLGGTAATADQYKDGWFIVQDGTGEGRAYPIEGNLAQATTTGTCTIYLYEAIDTAGALSESNCDLLAGKWNGTVISNPDQDDAPTGVPLVAVTEAYYYWSQVLGPCATLIDETATPVGGVLTIGSSVSGAVEEIDLIAEPLVGEVVQQAGVDTEYTMINLQIAI
ncbi:MAG: hypothetical protein GY861_03155 [bacterium]|nr:hypothetical protein [bacterium]